MFKLSVRQKIILAFFIPALTAAGVVISFLYFQFILPLNDTDASSYVIPDINTHWDSFMELSILVVLLFLGLCLPGIYMVEKMTKKWGSTHQSLHLMQNFDDLTGLANRHLFIERFTDELHRAQQDGSRVALLLIDLDRFKHVNDSLGHALGDALLKEAARRLQYNLAESDIISRLGGDEFAVVIADVLNQESIENTVYKLLECLSETFFLGEHNVFVSASIGITLYPDHGDSSEILIRHADSAMYRAKDDGRNGFYFYTLDMDAEAQARRILENDLHKALENGELSVHYQPIMHRNSDVMSSAEALVRWNHPQKGLISPIDFIPLAEEVGLILPMGEWILREACKEASGWAKISTHAPAVTVNMSSCQFQKQDVPAMVQLALAETGLDAHRLILEITESLLVDDNKQTMNQLQQIRSLGVGLSIDDFGTGYSSLSYLKKFPINTLKIDRSFIAELPNNKENAALVDAILAMAKSLHLNVVAEGVEEPEQAAFLQSRHCQYLQGFLYSQPLTKTEFIEFLSNEVRLQDIV
ncbi:putative bifunctional diguanylate cyclase/phosphodiesterase [sulfur-oxidizing endosymbiont of Gigantopelta aegis]|uniref:putative bifunctional diguanylate cyclase/phosphodiesterase n=1 Tax=sulfur-oxidizing endosymbiont of Gigantopelta aegis TaxID=2794934 RepID=UPI0018DC3C75|nr:EAL domain-containing protein [sulfur-oxidizing endosymbiont of Gigantopelta aegis]